MKKTKKKGSSSKEKFVGKKKSSKSIFSELDEATKKSYESKDSFGESTDQSSIKRSQRSNYQVREKIS